MWCRSIIKFQRKFCLIWPNQVRTSSCFKHHQYYYQLQLPHSQTIFRSFTKELISSEMLKNTKEQLNICMKKQGTNASIISIDEDVKKFCQSYYDLSEEDKHEIDIYLASNYSVNLESLSSLIRKYPFKEIEDSGKEHLYKWQNKLRNNLQPPYYWLAVQISRMNGGVKFLVDFRENLLSVKQNSDRSTAVGLKTLDSLLKDLLSLWFSVGLLDLQRITWDSPCNLLEKVSRYEAVHPMRNWLDLKRRVGNYRRCYIFTHTCMPNEPLVVLHTFLTNEISNSMKSIVELSPDYDQKSLSVEEDHTKINTALFYSITSTQNGLKGIELGNYLIKKVVKEIQYEFPGVHQFSSLSPIPGFSQWLQHNFTKAYNGEINILHENEIDKLKKELECNSNSEVYSHMQKILKTNSWYKIDHLERILQPIFMRLSSYYLFKEKHRSYAMNPVANFHLKNGAMLWRINWGADLSPRGLTNSCGIMVNYRYYLENCEEMSLNYIENGEIVASNSVLNLIGKCNECFNFKINPSKL